MPNVDKRKKDVGYNIRPNPHWIVSSELDLTDSGDVVVLFSFPQAGMNYVIDDVILEITEVFDDTPTITIGKGTMATDSIGAVTPAPAADYYLKNLSAAPTVLGNKTPGNAESVRAVGANNTIVGAATNVPVVYATVGAATALTQGKARLHLRIAKFKG